MDEPPGAAVTVPENALSIDSIGTEYLILPNHEDGEAPTLREG